MLTPEECADRLGYKPRYFKEKLSKKKGFPKIIGRRYYWPDVFRYFHEKAA